MKREGSLVKALVAMVLGAGVLVWLFTALTNDDLLWFLRSFNHEADWMTIYWDGEAYTVMPEDPHYEPIMSAFAEGVGKWSGYEGRVTMSEEYLQRYRDEGRLLSLHYNKPVQVHIRHPYPPARVFYVPFTQSHAHWRRVFRSLQEAPGVGVLNMSPENYERLSTAVGEAVQARR